jgi:hypothetical protein
MGDTLKDANGNPSSKRLLGAIILFNGIVMANTVFIMGLLQKIPDPDMVKNVLQIIFLTGGSLLGIGVVELFGKKK